MKFNLLKKTRAEITTTQLVTIILTIVGFVILMIVFYQFGFTGTVDREACHDSVILRATVSEIGTSLVQGYVPLKCQVKKMCVTSKFFGSGTCNDLKGVKGITKARVSDVDDVERVISQEVLECWKMMGEGKLDLFTQSKASVGIGDVYPTCVICSRIAFDKDSLDKSKINLTKVNPLNYMETHKAPGQEISYSQYLSGSPGKFSIEENILKETIVLNDKNILRPEEVVLENARTSQATTEELAVLFMQISAPSASEVFKNIGKITAVSGITSLLFSPIKTVQRILKSAIACAESAPVCISLAVIGGGAVGYNIYANRELSAGKCEDVLIGGKERSGCSVVRVTTYNITEISKYCSVIEGLA